MTLKQSSHFLTWSLKLWTSFKISIFFSNLKKDISNCEIKTIVLRPIVLKWWKTLVSVLLAPLFFFKIIYKKGRIIPTEGELKEKCKQTNKQIGSN